MKVLLLLLLILPHVVSSRHVRSLDERSGDRSGDFSQDLHDFMAEEETPPPPPADGGARPLASQDNPGPSLHTNITPPTDQHQPSTRPPPGDVRSHQIQGETVYRGNAGFGGRLSSDEDTIEARNEQAAVKGGVRDEGEEEEEEEEEEDGGLLARCGVCPPGTGVVTSCTRTRDTVCAPCPEGTYSKGHSSVEACRPCSACPLLHFQRTPCVADSDVRCGACNSHGSGFGNEDFREKCEGITTTLPPTTTTTATPTTRTESGSEVREVEGSGEVRLGIHLLTEEADPPSMISQDIHPTPQIVNVDLHHQEEEVRIGESKDEQVNEVKPGGFQWPILLAGIASGAVFFVVGIVTSMLCKKSHHERKQSVIQDDFKDEAVRTTMIRRSADFDSSIYQDSDSASPLNPGKYHQQTH